MTGDRKELEEHLCYALAEHVQAWRFAGLEWLPRPPACEPCAASRGQTEPTSQPKEEQLSQRQPSAAGQEFRPAPASKARQTVACSASSEPVRAERQSAREASNVDLSASLFDQPLESPARTRQEKARLLDELNRRHVVHCTKCPELVRNRTQTVFGVGDAGAELVLVGEAPGQEEDAQGEPFVGPAGQLLNRILAACGFRRQDVYICNVLKCRPPNNRTPLPTEIANCRGYLEQQLAIIAPKYICCLGSVAAQTLLQTNQSIGKLRGKVHRYRGAALICTYHPAYLLRNPGAKREVWEDMKLLLRTMGRPVPR